MSDFLGAPVNFGFAFDVNFDVVPPTGSKLEFGSTRAITLKRPNRAVLIVRSREGNEQSLYFYGKVLSIAVPGRETYAREELPGTIARSGDSHG